MKKTLVLGFLISLIFFTVTTIEAGSAAEAKPNFSGNWALDLGRSNFGRLGPAQFKNARMTLKISHREPQLKIARQASMNGQTRNQNLIYYTDGRGEANPNLLTNEMMNSKTKWEGVKLISRSLSSMAFNGQAINIEAIEKRELSSDGKTLTITNTISSPRGVDIVKLVFARKS
ncbi:MAG: hypothetical protein HY231_01900 [Acidobacteria bacterium]|nr:hypothetical protein [Acidobacteriota bacterium]